MSSIRLDHPDWVWSRASQESIDSADRSCSWSCETGSDYWRLTESGSISHSGHACLFPVSADFSIEGVFEASLEARYDQVGLIILKSETCWFKAGFELDDRMYVGGVHTRDTSDWSFMPADGPGGLKLSRGSGTVQLFWHGGDKQWSRIRQLSLEGPVQVGFYSAAPLGPGMRSTVTDLRLDLEV